MLRFKDILVYINNKNINTKLYTTKNKYVNISHRNRNVSLFPFSHFMHVECYVCYIKEDIPRHITRKKKERPETFPHILHSEIKEKHRAWQKTIKILSIEYTCNCRTKRSLLSFPFFRITNKTNKCKWNFKYNTRISFVFRHSDILFHSGE